MSTIHMRWDSDHPETRTTTACHAEAVYGQTPEKGNILIVDDTPANLRLLSRMLVEQGYKVRPVPDGPLALAAASAEPPDLILLDICMPGMDGYEICGRLKADAQTRDIPVIFISSVREVDAKVRAFAAGGVDYVTKPYNVEEVLARVETHLALRNLQKSLQEANEVKTVLLEQLRQQADLLEQQTREDCLTGLYNRRELDQRLALEFQRTRRFGHPLTVVMADIDFFKGVNDRFSHQVGDEVLKAVAGILQGSCRVTDFVARYGGEEFTLFLPETTVTNGVVLCEKIRRAIEAYDWDRIQPDLTVTISMGLAEDRGLTDHDALLRAADDKLYEAKHSGRNQVRY